MTGKAYWPTAARIASVVAVAGLGAWLGWETWLRWNDPQIDFGRELYLPWRILAGEHLGRDYLHPYGPLSVYLNAGLFALFGVSTQTLVVANLALFTLLCLSLHTVLRRGFGFLPATIATLFAVAVFGFPHYAGINNYTYALPYSHEATHGMVLLLAFLVWLGKGTPAAAPWHDAVACGAWVGLCSLTKTEYVLAAGVLGLAWFIRTRWQPSCSGQWWRVAVAQVLGFAAVVAVATAAACTALAPLEALKLATNALAAPFVLADYSQSAHVLRFLGADNLAFNLPFVGRNGMIALVALFLVFLTGRGVAAIGNRGARGVIVGSLAVGAWWGTSQVNWLFCASAFPVLLATALGILAWQMRATHRKSGQPNRRQWNQLLLLLAGGAMLARMAFDPTVSHYGFFQALLAGTALCAWVTCGGVTYAATDRIVRVGLLAAVVIFIGGGAAQLVERSRRFYQAKQTSIGEGADRILSYGPADYPLPQWWEQARQFISANTPANSTLLVVPEGLSLNFWTRRRHPLRIADLLPATLRLNGADVATELAARPPDTVVLVSRPNLEELGFARYGADPATGKAIVDWVLANCERVAQAGGEPFAPGSTGLEIYRRKARP